MSIDSITKSMIWKPIPIILLHLQPASIQWWKLQDDVPISHSTTFTSSYSMRDKLLSSFTVKLAGSVTSTRPHLSTASLIDPLNMSILALRRITVAPSFTKSTEDKRKRQPGRHKSSGKGNRHSFSFGSTLLSIGRNQEQDDDQCYQAEAMAAKKICVYI
ncbi:hypothetical protein CR513_53511, partial [Mucuna pruriens]